MRRKVRAGDRHIIRVRRERDDPRSPYLLAEEITVEHPIIFRPSGASGPFLVMESTGRRNRRRIEIVVLAGTSARGLEVARNRERVEADATAAGVKRACRLLRPREAARVDELSQAERRLTELRSAREVAVRAAWSKANVVCPWPRCGGGRRSDEGGVRPVEALLTRLRVGHAGALADLRRPAGRSPPARSAGGMTNSQPHTDEPTKPQLKLLGDLALETGKSFSPPRTFAEARVEIRALLKEKRNSKTSRVDRHRETCEIRDDMATLRGDAAAVRDDELGGYGPSAHWR
jgi:hypothetical protein